jgi:hypothetical protein
MPPWLQTPNDFKLKYLFGGQVPKKALAFDEFIYFDVLKFNHMGEQRTICKTLN